VNVSFDGTNKLIIVDDSITELDIQVDIYSAWKSWMKSGSNSKFIPALRTIGGDPTVGTSSVAPYFFLINGCKIRPYEGNHTLTLTGNLFVDEPGTYGSNITVSTVGYFQVLVNMSTTSDATVIRDTIIEQDKQEIATLVRSKILPMLMLK